MAVTLRLSRGGAKKRPYYRIVAADSRRPRDGRYLEQIGTYNPMLAKDDPARVKLDEDRARYWLGVGATVSDRVARFLDAAGIQERQARNNPQKGEPGEAAKERAEQKAAKEAEAAEAAKAAEEAPAEASSDEPAEGSENPATGDEAAIGASTDAPAEGSEEAVEGAAAEAEDTAKEAEEKSES